MSERYPQIEYEEMIVDNTCMQVGVTCSGSVVLCDRACLYMHALVCGRIVGVLEA